MRQTRCLASTVAVAILVGLPNLMSAQGRVADYQRALGLRETYQGLAIDLADAASWLHGSASKEAK